MEKKVISVEEGIDMILEKSNHVAFVEFKLSPEKQLKFEKELELKAGSII